MPPGTLMKRVFFCNFPPRISGPTDLLGPVPDCFRTLEGQTLLNRIPRKAGAAEKVLFLGRCEVSYPLVGSEWEVKTLRRLGKIALEINDCVKVVTGILGRGYNDNTEGVSWIYPPRQLWQINSNSIIGGFPFYKYQEKMTDFGLRIPISFTSPLFIRFWQVWRPSLNIHMIKHLPTSWNKPCATDSFGWTDSLQMTFWRTGTSCRLLSMAKCQINSSGVYALLSGEICELPTRPYRRQKRNERET